MTENTAVNEFTVCASLEDVLAVDAEIAAIVGGDKKTHEETDTADASPPLPSEGESDATRDGRLEIAQLLASVEATLSKAM